MQNQEMREISEKLAPLWSKPSLRRCSQPVPRRSPAWCKCSPQVYKHASLEARLPLRMSRPPDCKKSGKSDVNTAQREQSSNLESPPDSVSTPCS